MSTPDKGSYKLTIDLAALKHLGISLYSNVPAVLSEVVANAWDADAENVSITIDPKTKSVTISDDGVGMTEYDLNERYLKVGYSKRDKEPTRTLGHDRPVMGRKGIGKLSLFSIADVVEVQSGKTDDDGVVHRNGFIMKASEIKERIESQGHAGDYIPKPISRAKITLAKGTTITLRDLKNDLSTSAAFLRKRLARRFSIIGPSHKFTVKVNGEAIGPKDRDFSSAIQFVWYFGKESKHYADECKNALKSLELPATVNAAKDHTVSGWIGTFDEQKSIAEGNNTIVVLARGRLVQRDLLRNLDEAGLFTKYLIGEVRADFLDDDADPDIATSDRQRIREDDPRFIALRDFVQSAVKKQVKLSWTKWRNELAEKSARLNTSIDEWFKGLTTQNQKHARELFRKIETLPLPDADTRRDFYKQSILAFEGLALRENLSALDKITTEGELNVLAEIIGGMDEIEAAHYYQIVKGRVQVLKKLEKIKGKALEKVLQEHIFQHLWLLDPSWERASTDAGMEVIIGKEFKKIDVKLTKAEKLSRLDLRYQTAAGKHIVIELKKYGRQVTVFELLEQIQKYRGALEKVMKAKYPDDKRRTEFICIIGDVPKGGDLETIEKMLAAADARFLTYDILLRQARESYADYLVAEAKVARIEKLVNSL